jgi:hypothetical protein
MANDTTTASSEESWREANNVVAHIREMKRGMLAASGRSRLKLARASGLALSSFADSQERLAAASSVEWVSRFLRVQATCTRNVIDASAGSRASERAPRSGERAGRAAVDEDCVPHGRNEVT